MRKCLQPVSRRRFFRHAFSSLSRVVPLGFKLSPNAVNLFGACHSCEHLLLSGTPRGDRQLPRARVGRCSGI